MRVSLKIGAVVVVTLAWLYAFNLSLRLVSAQSDLAVSCGLLGLLVLAIVGLAAGGRYAKRLYGLLPLVALAVLATGCGTTVNPGYVGIQVDYYGKDKGVQSYPLVTGRVWYNPWTTAVLEYPTFVQTAIWTKNPNEGDSDCNKCDESVTFTNADQMPIEADISLSYHLVQDRVPEFYVKFRSDNLRHFTHTFLRNLARDAFNEHAGRYSIAQIMGDNAAFLRDVRDALQAQLTPLGVQLDQFGFVGAPRPPQAVIEAINAKVHATQVALQKQNELVQVQADAQKEVARAEGYARALAVKGEAESAYNRKLADSMSDRLIEKWRLDKWDGKLPSVTSGAVPLITVK